jgi:hypothetical protein
LSSASLLASLSVNKELAGGNPLQQVKVQFMLQLVLMTTTLKHLCANMLQPEVQDQMHINK